MPIYMDKHRTQTDYINGTRKYSIITAKVEAGANCTTDCGLFIQYASPRLSYNGRRKPTLFHVTMLSTSIYH